MDDYLGDYCLEVQALYATLANRELLEIEKRHSAHTESGCTQEKATEAREEATAFP